MMIQYLTITKNPRKWLSHIASRAPSAANTQLINIPGVLPRKSSRRNSFNTCILEPVNSVQICHEKHLILKRTKRRKNEIAEGI